MRLPTNSDKQSANTLTQKISLYFATIAIVVAALLFIFSQSTLSWLEDEINRRILEKSANPVISQFIRGRNSPLVIANNIIAYNDLNNLPAEYAYLTQYPIGFLDEIENDNNHGLFIYRTEYLDNNQVKPLLLLMDAEQAELSATEWRNINLASIFMMLLLLILFGYAIAKLTRRLITPVNQLSKQLKSKNSHHPFSVPTSSVTEFKELASSLNDYRSQNEQLIRQEQAFAKYASHELRTPLTIIQGAAKLLELKGDANFNTKQITRIAKAATDMNHTIEALLSLVKHDQDNDSNTNRIFKQPEIEQVIEYLQPLADSKSMSIKLILNAEPSIQPSIAVMRMLLSNLLSNAINASDSGDIIIIIDEHNISIIDTACGLNQTDNPEGHGLGLLIVDALCQRYHWTFKLSARQPSGSVASLTF